WGGYGMSHGQANAMPSPRNAVPMMVSTIKEARKKVYMAIMHSRMSACQRRFTIVHKENGMNVMKAMGTKNSAKASGKPCILSHGPMPVAPPAGKYSSTRIKPTFQIVV